MNLKFWVNKLLKGNAEKPSDFKVVSSYLFSDLDSVESAKDSEPVFITGVGRSGTHFLAELFNQSSSINAYHLDDVGNAVGDSFLMYAKWNGLPMDLQPFYSSRDYLIHLADKENVRFIESNPYLPFSVKDLADYYPRSKFCIVIRDPRKVVLSHYNKGWYENFNPNRVDMSRFPFYDYRLEKANHFFGRIFPHEQSAFEEWKALTRVGKISWMWQTINNNIKTSLEGVSSRRFIIVNIDSFDYDKYIELSKFLSLSNTVSKKDFENLRNIKPGKTSVRKFEGWGEKEEDEFNSQVRKFSGYNL